ncbi:hypothetical protein IW261DRAFT_1429435 [Armillaria novae-zelandiae]|uniref:Uncharacterized protein n=1 Tax=Armillaria novae-zelandiae TaxID=153914 RepID=A0AA39KEV0_9AGAR|nr:hypothetical protein IW261DRAFT_1429435 [Armillaria novae-zelandiae]
MPRNDNSPKNSRYDPLNKSARNRRSSGGLPPPPPATPDGHKNKNVEVNNLTPPPPPPVDEEMEIESDSDDSENERFTRPGGILKRGAVLNLKGSTKPKGRSKPKWTAHPEVELIAAKEQLTILWTREISADVEHLSEKGKLFHDRMVLADREGVEGTMYQVLATCNWKVKDIEPDLRVKAALASFAGIDNAVLTPLMTVERFEAYNANGVFWIPFILISLKEESQMTALLEAKVIVKEDYFIAFREVVRSWHGSTVFFQLKGVSLKYDNDSKEFKDAVKSCLNFSKSKGFSQEQEGATSVAGPQGKGV